MEVSDLNNWAIPCKCHPLDEKTDEVFTQRIGHRCQYLVVLIHLCKAFFCVCV